MAAQFYSVSGGCKSKLSEVCWLFLFVVVFLFVVFVFVCCCLFLFVVFVVFVFVVVTIKDLDDYSLVLLGIWGCFYYLNFYLDTSYRCGFYHRSKSSYSRDLGNFYSLGKTSKKLTTASAICPKAAENDRKNERPKIVKLKRLGMRIRN